jgi:hypothetical protein
MAGTRNAGKSKKEAPTKGKKTVAKKETTHVPTVVAKDIPVKAVVGGKKKVVTIEACKQ